MSEIAGNRKLTSYDLLYTERGAYHTHTQTRTCTHTYLHFSLFFFCVSLSVSHTNVFPVKECDDDVPDCSFICSLPGQCQSPLTYPSLTKTLPKFLSKLLYLCTSWAVYTIHNADLKTSFSPYLYVSSSFASNSHQFLSILFLCQCPVGYK